MNQRRVHRKRPKADEVGVYEALISLYKLTPAQIAEMTPQQQLTMLRANSVAESKELTFDTLDDYYAYLRGRGDKNG